MRHRSGWCSGPGGFGSLIPGIDDGSPDMQTSLKMARMSVADGVKVIACTPHIVPGLYDNSGPDIRRRVQWLQYELDAAGITCRFVPGCDAHIAADLVGKLKSGLALSINDGRTSSSSRRIISSPTRRF